MVVSELSHSSANLLQQIALLENETLRKPMKELQALVLETASRNTQDKLAFTKYSFWPCTIGLSELLGNLMGLAFKMPIVAVFKLSYCFLVLRN